MIDICIVMPVHNEVHSISSVISEWLKTLEDSGLNFKILAVNDGSTDGTEKVLEQLSSCYPNLEVVNRSNYGHGASCLFGYSAAIISGAQWILQIDSDGQCDPSYFNEFWKHRIEGKAIQGYRFDRLDGLVRLIISRLLSVVVFALTGKYLKDANVPYRLMDNKTLSVMLDQIPEHFDLANCLLSYLYECSYSVEWIPILFRDRTAGRSHLKPARFLKHSLLFVYQMCHYLMKSSAGLPNSVRIGKK